MKTEVEAAIIKDQIERLLQENESLKLQVKELQRLFFGSKIERFISAASPDGQMDLFTGTAPSEQAPVKKEEIRYTRTVPTKKKGKPVRTALPAHLPRKTEVIEPSFVEPGSKKIGEEITEVLEYNPANIYVRRIVRPKYATAKNTGVVIADLPSLPLPRFNAGAGILAYIMVSKFIDHLPFYRQIQIFKRQQLQISSSTMNDWFAATCKLLEPLYQELWKQIINNSNYLQADESPIGVQDSHKKGALHNGYMWLFRDPEINSVLFVYNIGRSREAPENVLENFSGTLQTDGYRAYQSLRTKGEITLLGCMAHARRYFEKALDNDPKRAEYFLTRVQMLYAMEQKAKDKNVPDDVVKRYRQIYAKPIIEELEKWMEKSSYEVLPKSSIGKAIAYTRNIYPALTRYIEDGKFEIDNNNIENAVRPLALGRKNYMFAGSHKSAQNIAMMYSFFATCKANEINPFTWLNDVLNRIQDHHANKLVELLPQNWTGTTEVVEV